MAEEVGDLGSAVAVENGEVVRADRILEYRINPYPVEHLAPGAPVHVEVVVARGELEVIELLLHLGLALSHVIRTDINLKFHENKLLFLNNILLKELSKLLI